MLVNIKPWRKVVFSDEKKFNLDNRDDFQNYLHAKNLQKRINQQGIVEEDLLSSTRLSHLQENLNYNLSVVDKKQQIMWRC